MVTWNLPEEEEQSLQQLKGFTTAHQGIYLIKKNKDLFKNNYSKIWKYTLADILQ